MLHSFAVEAVRAIEAAGIGLRLIQCDKEILGLEMQAAIGVQPCMLSSTPH